MSRRRMGTASPHAGTSAAPNGFRPVSLVQVDVDQPGSAEWPAAPGEGLVWVEAVRGGRVIGVVEARGATEPTAELRAIRDEDASSAVPPLDTVRDADLAKATVIVPTIVRNPIGLAATVDSLLAMDHPDFEVVVVDNRPISSPVPELSGFDRIRIVHEPRPGISAARNRGTDVAAGAVVAFTDDDAVADRRWLRALGSRFAASPDVEAIGGLVLPSELETEPQLWFEEFYGGFSQSFRAGTVSAATVDEQDRLFPYAPGRFGAGCNMAFLRATLIRMGGFDTTLGVGTPAKGGEDLAMFIALLVAGGTVAFEPSALVRHSHRRTEREFMRQVLNYGTGLTAMYTSLVLDDPRHLVAMTRRIPGGIRLLTRPREDRSPSASPTYPRRALAFQVAGMAYGPIAYALSAISSLRYR